MGNIKILNAFDFVVLLFKKLFSFVFNKKTFNLVMSFLMIVSLAYVTIETVDPEPALAASWDCLDSNGRPIAFQTEYSGGDLIVHRYNFSNGASLSHILISLNWMGSEYPYLEQRWVLLFVVLGFQNQ